MQVAGCCLPAGCWLLAACLGRINAHRADSRTDYVQTYSTTYTSCIPHRHHFFNRAMVFEVSLVDILPLINCKPEAEAVVSLKIHLVKLGHLLDASRAADLHRDTLIRLCNTAAASATDGTSAPAALSAAASRTISTRSPHCRSSRAAALHCIVMDCVIAAPARGEYNTPLKSAVAQLLDGLFHIEV